jgi:hypothetical protein
MGKILPVRQNSTGLKIYLINHVSAETLTTGQMIPRGLTTEYSDVMDLISAK